MATTTLTPTMGVEIHDVDLAAVPGDLDTIAAIRAALVDHHVAGGTPT